MSQFRHRMSAKALSEKPAGFRIPFHIRPPVTAKGKVRCTSEELGAVPRHNVSSDGHERDSRFNGRLSREQW